MTKPEFVFCADDFTGASDTLATLARAGLSARLFLEVSEAKRTVKTERLDAIGIASSLRSMERAESRKVMQEIAAGLASLHSPMVHLKICSTFDSSPKIGNVYEAANTFAETIGAEWIGILGGQPSLGRYCLFGNLFATAGDGELYRIDRHPTMKQHPITPMTEADLRKHLRLQGWEGIGLIDFRGFSEGPSALIDRLEQRIRAGEGVTLFDVSSDSDLETIGKALKAIGARRSILCVGASSVAEALYAAQPRATSIKSQPHMLRAVKGPIFAFAGSRSVVTAAQIASATLYEKLTVAPSDFLPGNPELSAIANTCKASLAAGRNTLVQLSDQRSGRLSGGKLAAATAGFIRGVIATVRPACMVIAGGDTSSSAIEQLAIDSISIISDFDRGVPLIRAHSRNMFDELPMVLKGGQMGGVELFDKLANSFAG